MATFLFWNVNNQPVMPLLRALCDEHDVDVLILAESAASEVQLLQDLNAGEDVRFFIPPRPWSGKLIKLVSRFPTECMIPVGQYGRASVLRLVPPIGREVTLVLVHLPSKMHHESIDQTMLAPTLAGDIASAEATIGHGRTVVIGDFNMNPFEPGIVGHTGLHATMTRDTAGRGHRTVQGRDYAFFYNPMWSLFGDLSPGPPGTYYDQSGRPVNYFWNMLDQVLVRPDLLDAFKPDRVAVLGAAGAVPLLTDKGRPTPSDHLPIVFDIDLQKE